MQLNINIFPIFAAKHKTTFFATSLINNSQPLSKASSFIKLKSIETKKKEKCMRNGKLHTHDIHIYAKYTSQFLFNSIWEFDMKNENENDRNYNL